MGSRGMRAKTDANCRSVGAGGDTELTVAWCMLALTLVIGDLLNMCRGGSDAVGKLEEDVVVPIICTGVGCRVATGNGPSCLIGGL